MTRRMYPCAFASLIVCCAFQMQHAARVRLDHLAAENTNSQATFQDSSGVAVKEPESVLDRLKRLAPLFNKDQMFGPYKMKERLGFGQFGEVWQAKCKNMAKCGPKKIVAIKVLGKDLLGNGDDWQRVWDVSDKESRGCSIQTDARKKAKYMGMDPEIINECIKDGAKECAEKDGQCMKVECPKGPTFAQCLDDCGRGSRTDPEGACHKPFLVLELSKGKELGTFQSQWTSDRFSPDRRLQIFKALVQGARILSAEGKGFSPIVHRDIKLDNIMIECPAMQQQHCQVKFLDFGNTLRVSKDKNRTSEPNVFGENAAEPFFDGLTQPIDQAPPEVYLAGQNFAACAVASFDMWSIGVVMYQLMTQADHWVISKYKSHARKLELSVQDDKLEAVNSHALKSDWTEEQAESSYNEVQDWREKMSQGRSALGEKEAMDEAVADMLNLNPCSRPSPLDVINKLELRNLFAVEVSPGEGGSYGMDWFEESDPVASRVFLDPHETGVVFAAGVRKGDVLHTVNGEGGNMAAPDLKKLLVAKAKSEKSLMIEFYSKIGVGSKDVRIDKDGSLGARLLWTGNFPHVAEFGEGSQLQAKGVAKGDEIVSVRSLSPNFNTNEELSLEGVTSAEGVRLIMNTPSPRIFKIRRSPKVAEAH